jgi:hypothetical protein
MTLDDLEQWLTAVASTESNTVEKLRSEVDAAGYDLILESGGVIRHVQLKAIRRGARTSKQTRQRQARAAERRMHNLDLLFRELGQLPRGAELPLARSCKLAGDASEAYAGREREREREHPRYTQERLRGGTYYLGACRPFVRRRSG